MYTLNIEYYRPNDFLTLDDHKMLSALKVAEKKYPLEEILVDQHALDLLKENGLHTGNYFYRIIRCLDPRFLLLHIKDFGYTGNDH